MRKSGGFSLACYIIYLLFGLGLLLYSHIVAPTVEGWEGLGLLVLIILGVYSAGIGLVGLIFKLLHMGTGAGFFGFLCILVDLFVIGVVVYSCLDGAVSLNDPTSLVLAAIPGGMFLISFISNIKSMRA